MLHHDRGSSSLVAFWKPKSERSDHPFFSLERLCNILDQGFAVEGGEESIFADAKAKVLASRNSNMYASEVLDDSD
jgi:hypothetical protein